MFVKSVDISGNPDLFITAINRYNANSIFLCRSMIRDNDTGWKYQNDGSISCYNKQNFLTKKCGHTCYLRITEKRMKFDIDFVKREHKKYQQIFKVQLPDFVEIEYNRSLVNEYAHVLTVSENIFKLELHPDIQLYTKQFVKSILYHEFTHQADAITCPYKSGSVLYSRYLKCYSEPHAAEIELRTILNDFYKSKIKLNVHTNVFFKNGLVPIVTYLNDRLFSTNFMSGYFNQICNIKDFQEYLQKIITVFYYIGYTSLLNEPESESIFNLVMTFINDEKIKVFVIKSKNLYCQGKISELTLLFEDMYYEVTTNMIRRQLSDECSSTLANSDINQLDYYNYKEKVKELIIYNQNNPIEFSEKRTEVIK